MISYNISYESWHALKRELISGVNPDKFDKLITSLRTAVDNDGELD